MKTTLMFRTIANPRRTTLAHLTAAEEAGAGGQEHAGAERAEQPEHAAVLPARTANPRRTILLALPGEGAQPEPAEAAAGDAGAV